MLNFFTSRRAQKLEGESPFWISFSDLMTALMALFLLVMAVTLISVTKDVTAAERRKIQREKDIQELMAEIRKDSREFPDVQVDASTYRIDLGNVVHFHSGSADISEAGSRFLRAYIPVILKTQATALGKEWIRRIVVEGYTDQDGTYLFNLGLSLRRSESVVCMLLNSPNSNEPQLSDEQRQQIVNLFLVGGYSFNSIKASKEESRRVELKIEFWPLDAPREPSSVLKNKEIGQC